MGSEDTALAALEAPLRFDTASLPPKFDSKLEELWYAEGWLWLASEFGDAVVRTWYHPLTLHLPGMNYTPDFQHVLSDGRMLFVECKARIVTDVVRELKDGTAQVRQINAASKQRGYRATRLALHAAQAFWPWAVWCEVRIGVERNRIAAVDIEIISGRE
jgi:hypothetical protein